MDVTLKALHVIKFRLVSSSGGVMVWRIPLAWHTKWRKSGPDPGMSQQAIGGNTYVYALIGLRSRMKSMTFESRDIGKPKCPDRRSTYCATTSCISDIDSWNASRGVYAEVPLVTR